MPGFYGPSTDPADAPVRPRKPSSSSRTEGVGTAAPLLLRRPLRLLTAIAILFCTGLALVRKTQYAPSNEEARLQLARENLAVLAVAMRRLEHDCTQPPSLRDGLTALIHDPGLPGWRGPYILALKPDPWLHPFVCRESAGSLIPFSLGPDGLADTSDDIQPPPQGATGFETGNTPVVPVTFPDSIAHSNFQDTVYQP